MRSRNFKAEERVWLNTETSGELGLREVGWWRLKDIVVIYGVAAYSRCLAAAMKPPLNRGYRMIHQMEGQCIYSTLLIILRLTGYTYTPVIAPTNPRLGKVNARYDWRLQATRSKDAKSSAKTIPLSRDHVLMLCAYLDPLR